MAHPLKYHQPVFDFLGEKPVFSRKQHDALKALEVFLKVKFPAAFVEWFSLENAESLITFNCDHVMPVDRFEVQSNPLIDNDLRWRSIVFPDDLLWRWKSAEAYGIDEKLLVFIVENQGVCSWALDLNDGADPQILMKWNEPGKRWLQSSEKFSAFVFARVWDTRAWFSDFSLQAFGKSFSFADLAYLESHYDMLPVNRPFSAYNICYRFQKDGKQILIPQGYERSDCHIYAPTLPELEALVRDIWHLSDLSESLEHYQPDSDLSKMLERIRKGN